MLRPNLNLARKWRSRTFDEIVGQELSIRVLKNSLYLSQYFPVYLFSGQRGCGKTSTARIFASALNCEALATFQNEPKKQQLPCLNCASCIAMQQGHHPDFIEIDAASHTGVDNVRQIIDAATLLPVMGHKKIYLIDEAHMLSKAAFNALLKILEEPPVSVLFILATTDVHKILDTVKSRCFQLLFKPIEADPLLKHLEDICTQEQILYEPEALKLLIKESDGSARDALNALEQIRLTYERVSVDVVHELFGHVDDATIVHLLEAILHKEPHDVLMIWSTKNLDHVSPSYLYYAVRNCLRAVIWQQYKQQCGEFLAYQNMIQAMGATYDPKQLTQMLQFLYEQELLFVRMSDQSNFVQTLLLQLCQKKTSDTDQKSVPVKQQQKVVETKPVVVQAPAQSDWNKFLTALDTLNDPLLSSIFKQAKFNSFDHEKNQIQGAFAKECAFFIDWLTDTKKIWEPVLQSVFGSEVTLKIIFDETLKAVQQPVPQPVKIEVPKPQPAQPQQQYQPRESQHKQTYQKREYKRDVIIDISDKQAWAKTHSILQHFPGTVCRETEGNS